MRVLGVVFADETVSRTHCASKWLERLEENEPMFEMLKSHTHRRPSARELVGGDGIVLDVRTREEFASGHVEGAINVPVQELGARLAELGRPRKVVVYCRSGARSAAAAQILERAGWDVTDIGPMPR